MRTFLKQFFCTHIWSDIHNVSLRKEKEHFDDLDDNFEACSEYYAVKQKCIKCQKEQFIEKRKVTLKQLNKCS